MFRVNRKRKSFVLFLILFTSISILVKAQIGPTIWQEDFNNLNNWIVEEGNGSWGWGNGELQYYNANNVRIDSLASEPNNNFLVISTKQETGPNIVDQWGNPLNYTSGRLNTKSFVSVKYGVIETRVRVPGLDVGGWPAVWMLGTSNYSWPRKGEIDMMEMGHSKWFRDLHDGHNGGNSQNNSTVNQMVGANAIFYSDDAINPQNPSGASSLSWDPDDDFCRPYYNYSMGLNDRFLIYRTYWDRDSLRFTVIDNNVEHELYTQAFQIDSTSEEFQNPFFFIVNMAVGGAFTDAYQLGDPSSGVPVSMTMPAEMYVDYIKVSEWNGQGSVHFGPPNGEVGTFGIYTDSTSVDDKLVPGVSSEVYVWEETLLQGSTPPYEGDNVLSWNTNGKGWFGAGIMSVQPLNMLGFENGDIKFRIKIPANVAFKIGIIDAWGNQNYIEFPANQIKYGLVRNGNWGQATIPVSDIRGTLIDLRMLSYSFVILEENGANCQFALDDIYWEGGPSIAIAENKILTNLKIYPNPTDGMINIETLENIQSIRVCNSHGQQLDIPIHNNQVDLSDISRGVYVIHITTVKGGVSRKIIRN